MSWKKIDDYLFDKYCVEVFDEGLTRLEREHDIEVKIDIIKNIKKEINDLEIVNVHRIFNVMDKMLETN